MPASYCEVHHCVHWSADHGRTDIDLGVMLCQFHHLHLHNKGWRITRDGKGEFLLHPPPDVGGPPIVLRSKSPLHFIRLLAMPERIASDSRGRVRGVSGTRLGSAAGGDDVGGRHRGGRRAARVAAIVGDNAPPWRDPE